MSAACGWRWDPAGCAHHNEQGEEGERGIVDKWHVLLRLLRVEEDGEEDVAEDGDGQNVEDTHRDSAVGRAGWRLEDAEQVVTVDPVREVHDNRGAGQEEWDSGAEDEGDADVLEAELSQHASKQVSKSESQQASKSASK